MRQLFMTLLTLFVMLFTQCDFLNDIAEVEPLTLSAEITNVTAEGNSDGAIDLTVTGGIAPYQYLWSNYETTEDLINISSGEYVINVMDLRGVIVSDTFFVSIGLPSDLIVDHKSAILDSIPTCWVDSAKVRLRIAYEHTSHGSQIVDGMNGLLAWKGEIYRGLDLRDRAITGGSDLGSATWDTDTRNYLNSHPEVNVVMWSWCGQVSTASEDYINNYLARMNSLETEFPNVRFIYMTGHLDGTGEAGNLNQRNEQIRNYCREHNKVLFDFADIESYDPDGNYFLNRGANDNCDYDGGGNWAIEWQNAHQQNIHWYTCNSAHSQPLNANLKAYAAWHMWARLGGWNGK